VHISEFKPERVEKITDVAEVGKEFTVKVIEIDDKGRINLSVKQASPDYRADNRDTRPPRTSGRRDDRFNNNRGGGRGGFRH
jgi:polyribonucleotide nucleotidyltransferase